MVIQDKVVTVDEYRAFIALPQNADKLFELIEGEFVEKIVSFTPSRIAARIGRLIGNYADAYDLVYVTGADGGYILAPGRIYMPDVGYISKARLEREPEREVEGPPDLAIEVKSPTDSKRELRRKAERYLEHGTRLVWLVFPDEGVVEVYAGEADVVTRGKEAVLDGADVLLGLALPVSEIFA